MGDAVVVILSYPLGRLVTSHIPPLTLGAHPGMGCNRIDINDSIFYLVSV